MRTRTNISKITYVTLLRAHKPLRDMVICNVGAKEEHDSDEFYEIGRVFGEPGVLWWYKKSRGPPNATQYAIPSISSLPMEIT